VRGGRGGVGGRVTHLDWGVGVGVGAVYGDVYGARVGTEGSVRAFPITGRT